MRAKLPDATGYATREGVRLHYEVYGSGPETIVFVPPWGIVHSRVYKAQLPYFSERFRCIAFDARGNGRSDRPDDVAAYSLANCVADALAVMDATDAGQAIVVGLSFGGLLACVLAAYHPERVKAAILVGTTAVIGPTHKHMSQRHFMARQECPDGKPVGWNKYNRAHWLADYPDFAEHFIRNIFTEPHSTRQIEEGIDWAGDTDGPVLVTISYHVEPAKVAAFVAASVELERSRRRTGARAWRLYRDGEVADRYVETFTVRSWGEHLRQHDERWTGYDLGTLTAVQQLADGAPEVRHLLPVE